jgi:ABC-2 type transport system permease protein
VRELNAALTIAYRDFTKLLRDRPRIIISLIFPIIFIGAFGGSLQGTLGLMFAAVFACLFGGAFGTIVMANLGNMRAASQIFPFILFPQLFLSGVFSPIKDAPPILYWIASVMPLTYVVDLTRSLFYAGTPEYDKVVLHDPFTNLVIICGGFIIMLVIGTWLFVRNERNR